MGAVPLGAPGILYDAPAHAKPGTIVVLKRPSYMKGEWPEHLRPFAGQAKACPVKCKGRKGQSFRLCMLECAKPLRK